MPVDLEPRELIARGAQGELLLVFDRALGRFLALKLVEVAGGAPAVERLLGDLKALASGAPDAPGALIDFGRAADAPAGVASAFPAGGANHRIWILMGFVDGPNARELALGDGRFGPAEVAALLAQLATRLRSLPPGLAHLDVKPENVLVDRQGRAHLVDFHLGTTAGTAGFSAPEQRGGGQPGPAADLYALGKLGAWLLARRFPEAADDPELFPALAPPPDGRPAAERRAVKSLGELLRGLCHPDPAQRGRIEEVAARLLELAAALGGPDPTAPLAASVARAKLPERLARLAAAIARGGGDRGSSFDTPPPAATQDERGSATPLALSSPPFDNAQDKLRGRIEGRTRVPLYALAALVALGTAGYSWYRLRAADGNPAPSTPALDLPAQVNPADFIRPLGPTGKHAPGHGLWEMYIDQPVKRVTLRLGEGPVLWENAAPKFGDNAKFDVVPHDYVVHIDYPNGFYENAQLNVVPGSEDRWRSHDYRDSAPVLPPEAAPAAEPLPAWPQNER